MTEQTTESAVELVPQVPSYLTNPDPDFSPPMVDLINTCISEWFDLLEHNKGNPDAVFIVLMRAMSDATAIANSLPHTPTPSHKPRLTVVK